MSSSSKLIGLVLQIVKEIQDNDNQQPDNIETQYLDQIQQCLASSACKVDRRSTDMMQGVYEGFAAIHYAAMHNLSKVFDVLFGSDEKFLITGCEVQVPYKQTLLPVPMGSSPLQLALIRRSDKIINYYIDVVNKDEEFRAQFLPFQNRLGATHLQVAALCADCPQALLLIENPYFVQEELPVNATTESFFTVICTFGQMKPFTSLMTHMKDRQLKELIYKTVLMNWVKPSYLDLCERDVDYALFQTSRTQKQQLKKKMAILIQDALDFCANQTTYEYQMLKNEWRKNILYYYEEDDVQRVNGQKICIRNLHGDEVVETEPAFTPYADKDWFDGTNVNMNKVQYVGRRDVRQTDAQNRVFEGFTLSFYCVLRQDAQNLQLIIDDEKDVVLQQTIVLSLQQGEVILLSGSSLMHAAILLNSPPMVEFLLKQNKKWLEQNEKEENAYQVAIQAKNQASIVLLRHQSFYQQLVDEELTKKIIKQCFDVENIDVLKTIVSVLNSKNLNQQITINRAALQVGPPENNSAECKRIYKLLVRNAREYVLKNELYAHPDWEEIVRQHYGDKYEEITDATAARKAAQLRKLEERTNYKFSLAQDVVISDACYDTKYEEYQRSYYDEVQVFEEQLFRDRNVMDEEFDYKGMRGRQARGEEAGGETGEEAAEGAEAEKAEKTEKLQAMEIIAGGHAGAEEAPEGEAGEEAADDEEERRARLQEDMTVMNMLVNEGNEEQLEAIGEIVRDDIVAKIPKRLQDWFEACHGNNLSLATSMHRSHLHAVDLRPTDAGQGIYNGFCGIHYAILQGNLQIVQLLLDYELCDTTKARVLVSAPGIGEGKQVVLPIGSNCLQLAALSNQAEILRYLIEEICARNTARFIDPVQQSFGKKPPLSVHDKLSLLTMKNELDQNILCTLCTCVGLLHRDRAATEEIANQILLEYQTKQLDDGKPRPKGTTAVAKKEEENNNLIQQQVANNADSVVSQRIDLAVKLCALYVNAPLLRLIRQELVNNPIGRFSDESQATVSFQIMQQILDIKQDYQYLYQEEEFKDIQREVDSTAIMIAATLHLKQKQNNQTWENQFSSIEQNEIFQQYKEQAIKNIELLQRPAYQTEFAGNFVRIPKEIITPHYYYLDNVIQSPQVNCYFDAVINGDIEFINLTYKEFAGKIDKRQTRGRIINGFTGLLYACYYSHYEIIKLLLQLEYNINANQQVLVNNGQFSYVFKQNVNFVQAAILSNDQDLVQQLMTLSRQQQLLHDVVFPPNQQTDIMKLAIFNKCGVIFQFGDLIQSELIDSQAVLEQNNQVESVLYSVSKERDANSILQIKNLLINYNDKSNDNLLHAFYYSCLQRLDNVDENADLRSETSEQEVLKMTSLDFLYSTIMTQLKQPETQEVYQSAIMFINQLTNSAILYAFEQVVNEEREKEEGQQSDEEGKKSIAQSMLEQYYGDDYEEKKQFYLDHQTEFRTQEWLYDKEESANSNYVVELRQIASQDFEQYSNLQQMNTWFNLCSFGDVSSIKKIYKKCIRQTDQRINNYRDQVYTNFTGLMYSIINNNIQAFEILLEDEVDINLTSEQVLCLDGPTDQVYYYLPPNFTPLHLAALGGNQQFFNILQKIYESKQLDATGCEVSASSLACVTNKEVTETFLYKDFQNDTNLFRYAVQYARTSVIRKLAKFGKKKENKDTYYRQVFNRFQYKDEQLTALDLITMLVPGQNDITQAQITVTQNLTRQIIANCLSEMIQDNVIGDYSELLDRFYDIEQVVPIIKEEYNQYIDPQVLQNPDDVTYSRVQQANLLIQQQNYSFYEHTQLEVQWFAACRMNDVQFVKNNLKNFSNSTDKRQTTVQQKIHRGFTGLMYAIVYNSMEVVDALLEIEYETRLQQNTAVQIEQQYYYIPQQSNILHIALLTNNQLLIEKLSRKIRQTSAIWRETNQMQLSCIMLMAGLNQCFKPIIDNFIAQFTKYEFLTVLKICIDANNWQLVKQLINIGKNNKKVKEMIYEVVFELSIKSESEPNEAQQLLLKQQDLAIIYALKQVNTKSTPAQQKQIWQKCLENMYGDDIDKAQQEYDDFQMFSAGHLINIEPEQLQQQFFVLEQDQIVPPPELTQLPQSRLTQEQINWFEACKNGDTRYVNDNIKKFAGIMDDRASLQDNNYLYFTGLMYAVINDQFDVFQTLLPLEMDIRIKQPTVIKTKMVERFYLIDSNSSVVNLAAITSNCKICSWIVQQRDNKAYGHLFGELCTNECLIQQVIGHIYFNEEVLISYLMHESSENIVAQLFLLGDVEYITKLKQFVETCGTKDKFVQEILYLCLTANQELHTDEKMQDREIYQDLYETAINYAISQYKVQIWRNLLQLNLPEDEIEARIEEFKQQKQSCDLIEQSKYDEIYRNAFVIEDESVLLPVEQVQEQRDQFIQDSYYDEWFDSCKEGNLDFIQRSFSDCIKLADKRSYSPENDIYTGWSGIHYAAYFNHLNVVDFLFKHEYNCVTQNDCAIDSMGIGYGTKFLHSKLSTVLQTAILADNIAIVKYICAQIEQDQGLLRTFMKPNLRSQSAIFTACIAWRSRSGQYVLNSKLVQLEMNFQKQQFDSYNAVQAVLLTNCAHFARDLFVRMQNDNQLKINIYTIALQCDKLVQGTYGQQAERDYVTTFSSYLLRDAMNYCLAYKQTIQWNTVFESYCQRNNIYGKALAIQYARTNTCVIIDGCIHVDEEFVEIAQGKLKPVEGTQTSGIGKLPDINKLDAKNMIARDWDELNQMLDDYENGLQDNEKRFEPANSTAGRQ